MMSVLDLWVPIAVATVAAFIGSFVAWALSPHHKPDWRKLGEHEGSFLSLVKSTGLTPGQYLFPYVDPKDPDCKEKQAQGCFATLTVFPGMPNMARNMGLTVLTFLVITATVAYLATMALERGAGRMEVVRFVGTAALLGHAFGGLANDIWFGKPTRAMAMCFIDALAYAAITAAVFAWLWPTAASAAA